jgi:hypothetical protein
MVRGRKNPLPLSRMEMGLAIMFKLETDSVLRRLAAGQLPAARVALAIEDENTKTAPADSAPAAADDAAEEDGDDDAGDDDAGDDDAGDEDGEDGEDGDSVSPTKEAATPSGGGGRVSKALRRRAKRLMERSDGSLRLSEAMVMAAAARDADRAEQEAAEEAEAASSALDDAGDGDAAGVASRGRHRGKGRRRRADLDEDEEALRRLAMGLPPLKSTDAGDATTPTADASVEAAGDSAPAATAPVKRVERAPPTPAAASGAGTSTADEEELDEEMRVLGGHLPAGVDAAAASLVGNPAMRESAPAAAHSGPAGGRKRIGRLGQETADEEPLAAEPAAAEGAAAEGAAGEATDDEDDDAADEAGPESETLMYAVPVVAPWPVVSGMRWAVKLSPGPGKRGKVGKAAMLQLLDRCARSGSERELAVMRRIPDDVLIQAMIGDVKLAEDRKSKGKGGAGKGKGGAKRGGRGGRKKHKKGER